MSDQYATPPAAKGRRRFAAGLLFLVLLAVAGGVTLSRGHGTEAGPGAAREASAVPPISVPAAAGRLPSDAVPGPGGGTPTAATTTRRVSTARSSAPAEPVIVHFRVASEPSCPSGTDQVRYEGEPVVLEWKVTGADRTTLAVDGPGRYAEYGVTGSTRVNFPCGGEPGSDQSHTYTLTAFDGDVTKSKTLTVTARVGGIAAT